MQSEIPRKRRQHDEFQPRRGHEHQWSQSVLHPQVCFHISQRPELGANMGWLGCVQVRQFVGGHTKHHAEHNSQTETPVHRLREHTMFYIRLLLTQKSHLPTGAGGSCTRPRVPMLGVRQHSLPAATLPPRRMRPHSRRGQCDKELVLLREMPGQPSVLPRQILLRRPQ